MRRILGSTTYKGEWSFGKTRRVKRRNRIKPDGMRYKTPWKRVATDPSEWIIASVPAIIEAETWERARERLTENKRYARVPKYEYLLRGMVYCSCGRLRHGNTNISRNGQSYYRCATSNARQPWRGECDARFGIWQDVLDELVWEQIVDRLLDPDNLLLDVERQREEEAGRRARHEQQIKALNTELGEIDRRISQLLDQALDGFPADVVAAKRTELIEQREFLTEERDRLEASPPALTITEDVKDMVREVSNMFRETLAHVGFEKKRQYLRLLQVRIDVIDRDTVAVSGILSDTVLSISCQRMKATSNCAIKYWS